MEKSKLFLLYFLILLNVQQVRSQINIQELYSEKGFVIQRIEINQGISTKIVVAIIDPSLLRAKIVGYTENNVSGQSAMRAINSPGVRVVLGSGFVKSFYPLVPNGFLKIDRQVISPANIVGYTEVVGVNQGLIEIVSSTDSYRLSKIDEGFQTGPPLLIKGVNEYVKRKYYERKGQSERYNRSFVGINDQGMIVAAITEVPLNLKELSEFLFAQKEVKTLRCQTIINLSGGSSETLVFKKLDGSILFFGGGPDFKEASLLTFIK